MPNKDDLDRLIKLLKMTTVAEDTVCLVAIRKANQELVQLGGDWERLLRGKVTIIEDPFKNAPAPSQTVQKPSWTPQAPPRPQPPPPPPRPQPPPQATRPPPQPAYSSPRPRPGQAGPGAARGTYRRKKNPPTLDDLTRLF